MYSLEKVVLTGKNKGKGDCGKQRLTYLDNIGTCLGKNRRDYAHSR